MKKILYLNIMFFILNSMYNIINAQNEPFGSWILPSYYSISTQEVNRLNFYPGNDLEIDIISPQANLQEHFTNSAGAFSEGGTLLFYTLGKNIYNSENSFIGTFTDNVTTDAALDPEIEIIKMPGTDYNFIIIWSAYDGAADEAVGWLYNTKVVYDPNSGSIAINQPEMIESVGGMCGFAVTRPDEEGNRQLWFSGSAPGLCVTDITQDGVDHNYEIIMDSNVGFFENPNNFLAYDVEVIETINSITKVAWITLSPYNNGCKKVFGITKDGSTITMFKFDFNNTVVFDRMSGIEFSPVNDNTLYFSANHSGNGGIYSLNLTNGAIAFLNYSSAYSRTYLETAADGNIYAVKNDGLFLGRITPGVGFTQDVLQLMVSTFFNLSEIPYYILPEDHRIFTPLSLALNLTQFVSCPGGNDGILTASVTGGNLPYSYSWYKQNGTNWTPLQFTGPQATGLSEGWYRCCVATPVQTLCEEMQVTIDPDQFTHNEMWNTYGSVPLSNENQSFLLGITVNPNSTLTLTNCTFQFAKGAKIIVKQGGKLVLDHSTLTHFEECGEMWAGVEVWGNKAYPQSATAYQGWVLMQNGSSIKNAMVGVYLAKRTGSTYDKNSTGGFIEVPNNGNPFLPAANFINNTFSIVFYPYKNLMGGMETYNRSSLRNCLFEVNANYMGGSWYQAIVYANGVNGVKFYGCTFTNNYSDLATGYGIYGLASGFIVEPICNSTTVPCPENSLDKCEFNRLNWGINMSNSGTYTLFTKNALFNNNSTGIRLTNVNYATVLFSNFNIGMPSSFEEEECDESASGYGIDMTSCSGFAIEENYFTKAQGAPLGNYIGIRVNSCPSVSDIIYLNEFVGLSVGNLAQGINRSEQLWDWTGVAYLCNQNSNNSYDFHVATNSMIKGRMGSLTSPAGNVLTNPSASIMQFQNDGTQNVEYYYNVNNTDEWLIENTLNVTPFPINYNNFCQSHYGGGGTGGRVVLTIDEILQKEQEYYSGLNNYNNVEALYESLKDGGNTEQMLSEVASSWPSEMWVLRAELLGKSPHLSKEVLMTVANKTNVLPESVIFEIMVANPDELRNEELIGYLENKTQPLPEYMIDILRQIANGITYKTALRCQMSTYHSQKIYAANDIIRSLLNDTLIDYNALRTWLDNIGNYEVDKQIILSYINEGNYSSALNLIQILPTPYELTADQIIEYNQYKSFTEWLIGLHQQNKTIFDLDSLEVDNLVNIAENGTGSAMYGARGILEYAYGYHYSNCPSLPEICGLKSSIIFNGDSKNNIVGFEINTQPNPAKDWVAIDYRLPMGISSASLKIMDITGIIFELITLESNTGQYVWDIRSVQPGVYLFTINAGLASKSGKIVIE